MLLCYKSNTDVLYESKAMCYPYNLLYFVEIKALKDKERERVVISKRQRESIYKVDSKIKQCVFFLKNRNQKNVTVTKYIVKNNKLVEKVIKKRT